jgi:hypothetical protein
MLAFSVPHDRLRPELITITSQGFEVDLATSYRPEAATAGLIAQILAVIYGTDENALAWRLDQSASVWRTEAIYGAGHEGFNARKLCTAYGIQLRQFDDPRANRGQGGILATEIGNVVGEPRLAEAPNCG